MNRTQIPASFNDRQTTTLSAEARSPWSLELSLVILLPAFAVVASLLLVYVAYVKGFTEIPAVVATSQAHHPHR